MDPDLEVSEPSIDGIHALVEATEAPQVVSTYLSNASESSRLSGYFSGLLMGGSCIGFGYCIYRIYNSCKNNNSRYLREPRECLRDFRTTLQQCWVRCCRESVPLPSRPVGQRRTRLQSDELWDAEMNEIDLAFLQYRESGIETTSSSDHDRPIFELTKYAAKMQASGGTSTAVETSDAADQYGARVDSATRSTPTEQVDSATRSTPTEQETLLDSLTLEDEGLAATDEGACAVESSSQAAQ